MLFVVAILAVLPASDAGDPPPTITYVDPHTEERLTCTRCPPGTRVRAPCTRTQATDCVPCPSGHYTQYWNFVHRCLPCRAPCEHSERERQQCAPEADRQCECAPGYYWRGYECVRHARCKPGFGAKLNGTAHTDTKCERCPRGTFSAGNSEHAQCTPHTGCTAPQFKALRGTSWHDDVCMCCSQINGGRALLQDFLIKCITYENPNVRTHQRFIRLLYQQTQMGQPELGDGFSTQDLLQHISKCTEAPDKQILEALEKSKLYKTANKLRKILKKSEKCKR